ncbi:transcriptional regulator, TetR family [Tissierella praeacuta DSM 18095]|uniref:Transcriptional regulator, TetR family n=1 Tax=Tissierella praeacuta DSM 18095 TaxID=1123404 RepID=A0A1M4Y5Z4_9FIRM|nr:TetR/AcrR family transcriptional regulator [Tissierella praeacuta]SHF01090.1 transcriptional regulator, TetR family [Tissierella praeacuta DSM 18095]SUO98838.1 transcriptional repressor BetI [Tissierella praeacuta]
MTNKEIQRKRMMSYFINATDELIYEEGINGITLRKVADRAGYNSATLYNYFENLDHLLFYAAMRNIKDYALALNTYLIDAKNSMDVFLKVWECFCDYAYDKPEIYNAIFFPNLEKHFEDYVAEYYKLFPEDMVSSDENISTMLLKSDINKRGETTVIGCVDEGYIRPEDANKLNDMTLLIFEGMLKRVLMDKISYDDARNNTMDYIKSIVERFLIKEYNFYY